MTRDDALGSPGCPAGMTDPGCVVLGERRQLAITALRGEQVLVARFVRESRVHLGAVLHDDDLPYRQPIAKLGEHARERRVDEDDLVAGVLHELNDLIAHEPHVDRVHDALVARNTEEELDVPVGVPGEGGDAPSRRNAQILEDTADPDRTLSDVAPRAPVDASGCDRDDFDRATELDRVSQSEIEREGEVLHQALHDWLPVSVTRPRPKLGCSA